MFLISPSQSSTPDTDDLIEKRKESNPRRFLLFLDSDSTDSAHVVNNYELYKFGTNQKKFEEQYLLEKLQVKRKDFPELRIPRDRIISHLGQGISSVQTYISRKPTETQTGEEVSCIVKDILRDCQSVIAELGIYPYAEYSLRSLKLLADLKSTLKTDEIALNVLDSAITTLRTCSILTNNEIKKIDVGERLISDNLWAALYIIQNEFLEHNRDRPLKPEQPADTNSSINKPSWWDNYFAEPNEVDSNKEKQKDFKRWILKLSSRACVLALNRFLEETADQVRMGVSCNLPSFTSILTAFGNTDENVESRILPVLDPPRFNTAECRQWSTDKLIKKFEKAIRNQMSNGKQFELISGGAVLLMCRDVPAQFSFVEEYEKRPLADFGIRLTVPDSYEQLPAKTKVWNLVNNYAKASYVDDVRENLHRLIREDSQNIKMPSLQSPRKSKTTVVTLDTTKRNDPIAKLDEGIVEHYNENHNASPAEDVGKLVANNCRLTPFTSDQFFVVFKKDPADSTKVKALLSVPTDFPHLNQILVFESSYVRSRTEAEREVSMLVLSEIRRLCPEILSHSARSSDYEKKPKYKLTENKNTEVIPKLYEKRQADALSMDSYPSAQEAREVLFDSLIKKFNIQTEPGISLEDQLNNRLEKENAKQAKLQKDYQMGLLSDHPFSTGCFYLYEIRMERKNVYYKETSQNPFRMDEAQENNPDIWSPSDEQCFGILSRRPLGSLPPFELYDKIPVGGAQNQVGVIEVTIVPVKSMITLDEEQVLSLEHFHRIVALTNNLMGSSTKFYRDNLLWEYNSLNRDRLWELENATTPAQKFGQIAMLYVPLAIGKASSQLPWKGYDIDWGQIAKMKAFEARQHKVAIAKGRFLTSFEKEKQKHKIVRQRITSLQRSGDDNPDIQAKIREDEETLHQMESELKEKMGNGKFYTSAHPLLSCPLYLERHIKSMVYPKGKVYFTPWNKLDEDDAGFMRIWEDKLNASRTRVNGVTYNWDDNDLRLIYPRANQLYTKIEPSRDVTGNTRDNGTTQQATSEVTYFDYANRGYMKKSKKANKPNERMFPKYPTVARKDEKLMRVQKHWMREEDKIKMFVSKSFGDVGVVNRDHVKEVSQAKFHFKEHLEEFFLNLNMLNQSARLASVTFRISQLVSMEEFRHLMVDTCHDFVEKKLTATKNAEHNDGNYEAVNFESTKNILSRKEGKVLSVLQRRSITRLPPKISQPTEETVIVKYDVEPRRESSNTDLGLLHPPPVIGGDDRGGACYFIPPLISLLSDKCSKTTVHDVLAKSGHDKLNILREHIDEMNKRGWQQISTKSKTIGLAENFCGDLFRSSRTITIQDQIAAIDAPFERRDFLEPDFSKNPLHIDWEVVVGKTRKFIQNMVSSPAIELLEQIFYSDEHRLFFDLEEYQDFYVENESSPPSYESNAEFLDRLLKTESKAPNIIENSVMGPSPGLLFHCFTQASAEESFNLTRLEFIGDAFLKIATTRVLYDLPSLDTPKKLSDRRNGLLSNKHLAKITDSLELGEFMNVLSANNRDHIIYPFCVHTVGQTAKNMKKVSSPDPVLNNMMILWDRGYPYQKILDSKKIPDSVEALLGAYLVTGGEKMAARLMQVLQYHYEFDHSESEDYMICPDPNNWPDLDESCDHLIDTEEYKKPTAQEEANIESIETRISDSLNENKKPGDWVKFSFANRGLARLSLAMAQYDNDGDNEKLEFLGDAVLDYIVAVEYYMNESKYQAKKPLNVGELSSAKQAICTNNMFGSVGFVHLFAHNALNGDGLKGKKRLSQLEDLKVQLDRKNGIALNPDLAKALYEYGPPRKASALKCPFLLDVPKWFGDIYEAVFGAIWLDQKQSLPKMRKIVLSQLRDLMNFDLVDDKMSFKSLNPRKCCEEIGNLTVEDHVRINERNLKNFGVEEQGEYKYIGKFGCKFTLKKGESTTYQEVGIGSTEKSAIFNTAWRMLEQIKQ